MTFDLRNTSDADLRFQLALISGELAQRKGGGVVADVLRNIGDHLSGAPRLAAPPVVRDVISAVCSARDVQVAEVLGPKAHRRLAEARWEIWTRLDALRTTQGRPRFSRSQLGAFLNRDHTTVLHGLKRWADLCEVDG